MIDQTGEEAQPSEHAVTPLELFFDLALVFAVTQVTGLVVDQPTWTGLLGGCSCSPRPGGPGAGTPG